MNELELLMPAGDLEKLRFAFAYGADAVYVGAPMFSLRARTNAFTLETLKEATEYAHSLGKKIYFTANIYAHNFKIEPFLVQFRKMVEMKPDAFIMADPGLIYLVRKEFPNVVIHLSVQANNTNWAQVQFWKEIGIKRIILSREISIKEMKEIHEKVSDVELEAFVHGAICMAYSGRCLISNYLSNRDSNQGTCSHSCRWEYKVFKEKGSLSEAELENATGRPENYEELTGNYYLEEKERKGELMEIDEDQYGTYLMNSRDLCAIDYLEDLKNAGIISFKVEGRNKTINYLASVGMAYRKAIDAVERGEKYDARELAEELFSIANRGYIPGFLAGNLNEKAQFYEQNASFGTKVFLGILRDYDEKNKLVRVEVKNRFEAGDEIEMISPITENEMKKNGVCISKGVGLNDLAKSPSTNIIFQNILKVKKKINFYGKIDGIVRTGIGNIIFNSDNIFRHFKTKHVKEFHYRKGLLAMIFSRLEEIKFQDNIGYFAFKNHIVKVILGQQNNGNYFLKTFYVDDKLTKLYNEPKVESPKLIENGDENLKSSTSYSFKVKKMKVEKIFKTPLNHGTHKANTTFTEYKYTFDEKVAESVNEAHGGGYEVWINMDEKPKEFSLIRKEI